MNKIIAAILLLFSMSASAVDVEIGIGKTSHTIDGSYSIGISGEVFDGWKVRAGYENLGTPKFNLLVPDYAAWDDIYLAGGPVGQYYFLPMQRNHGLYLTVGPEWKVGEVTYGIEVGVLRYNPQWQEEYMPGMTKIAPHTKRTNYSPILGVSAGYDSYELAIEATNVNYWGDWEGGIPTSKAFTLWLRRVF